MSQNVKLATETVQLQSYTRGVHWIFFKVSDKLLKKKPQNTKSTNHTHINKIVKNTNKLSLLLIVLIVHLVLHCTVVNGFCVWQGGGGFRLACGFKQSGLFRLKSLGGLKGWAGAGFTVGDEDGFKDSITNTENKPKNQYPHANPQSQNQRQSFAQNYPKSFPNPQGHPHNSNEQALHINKRASLWNNWKWPSIFNKKSTPNPPAQTPMRFPPGANFRPQMRFPPVQPSFNAPIKPSPSITSNVHYHPQNEHAIPTPQNYKPQGFNDYEYSEPQHFGPIESHRKGVIPEFAPMPDIYDHAQDEESTLEETQLEPEDYLRKGTSKTKKPYGLQLLENSENYGKKFHISPSTSPDINEHGVVTGYDTNLFPDIYITSTTPRDRDKHNKFLDIEDHEATTEAIMRKLRRKKIKLIRKGHKLPGGESKPITLKELLEAAVADELASTSSTTRKTTTTRLTTTTTTTQPTTTTKATTTTTTTTTPAPTTKDPNLFNWDSLIKHFKPSNMPHRKDYDYEMDYSTTPKNFWLNPYQIQASNKQEKEWRSFTPVTTTTKSPYKKASIDPLITTGKWKEIYDPRFPPDHEVNKGKLQLLAAAMTTTTTEKPFYTMKDHYTPSSHYDKSINGLKTKVAINGGEGQFVKFDSRESFNFVNRTKAYNNAFYNHFNKTATEIADQPTPTPYHYFSAFKNSYQNPSKPTINHGFDYMDGSSDIPWFGEKRNNPSHFSRNQYPDSTVNRQTTESVMLPSSHDTWSGMKNRPESVEENGKDSSELASILRRKALGMMGSNWEPPRFGPGADFVTNDNFKTQNHPLGLDMSLFNVPVYKPTTTTPKPDMPFSFDDWKNYVNALANENPIQNDKQNKKIISTNAPSTTISSSIKVGNNSDESKVKDSVVNASESVKKIYSKKKDNNSVNLHNQRVIENLKKEVNQLKQHSNVNLGLIKEILSRSQEILNLRDDSETDEKLELDEAVLGKNLGKQSTKPKKHKKKPALESFLPVSSPSEVPKNPSSTAIPPSIMKAPPVQVTSDISIFDLNMPGQNLGPPKGPIDYSFQHLNEESPYHAQNIITDWNLHPSKKQLESMNNPAQSLVVPNFPQQNYDLEQNGKVPNIITDWNLHPSKKQLASMNNPAQSLVVPTAPQQNYNLEQNGNVPNIITDWNLHPKSPTHDQLEYDANEQILSYFRDSNNPGIGTLNTASSFPLELPDNIPFKRTNELPDLKPTSDLNKYSSTPSQQPSSMTPQNFPIPPSYPPNPFNIQHQGIRFNPQRSNQPYPSPMPNFNNNPLHNYNYHPGMPPMAKLSFMSQNQHNHFRNPAWRPPHAPFPHSNSKPMRHVIPGMPPSMRNNNMFQHPHSPHFGPPPRLVNNMNIPSNRMLPNLHPSGGPIMVTNHPPMHMRGPAPGKQMFVTMQPPLAPPHQIMQEHKNDMKLPKTEYQHSKKEKLKNEKEMILKALKTLSNAKGHMIQSIVKENFGGEVPGVVKVVTEIPPQSTSAKTKPTQPTTPTTTSTTAAPTTTTTTTTTVKPMRSTSDSASKTRKVNTYNEMPDRFSPLLDYLKTLKSNPYENEKLKIDYFNVKSMEEADHGVDANPSGSDNNPEIVSLSLNDLALMASSASPHKFNSREKQENDERTQFENMIKSTFSLENMKRYMPGPPTTPEVPSSTTTTTTSRPTTKHQDSLLRTLTQMGIINKPKNQTHLIPDQLPTMESLKKLIDARIKSMQASNEFTSPTAVPFKPMPDLYDGPSLSPTAAAKVINFSLPIEALHTFKNILSSMSTPVMTTPLLHTQSLSTNSILPKTMTTPMLYSQSITNSLSPNPTPSMESIVGLGNPLNHYDSNLLLKKILPIPSPTYPRPTPPPPSRTIHIKNDINEQIEYPSKLSEPAIQALKNLALHRIQHIQPSPEISLPQQTAPQSSASPPVIQDDSGWNGMTVDLGPLFTLASMSQPTQVANARRGRKLQNVRNAPKSYYPGENPLQFETSNNDFYSDFYCEKQEFFPGLYADQSNSCQVFHLCAKTNSGFLMKSFKCPKDTLFDQEILRCNWSLYVKCHGVEDKYHFNKYLSQSFQFLKTLGDFSANYKLANTTLTG